MDTLGALAFGIVLITAIKDNHAPSREKITSMCIKAGAIAALGLTFVYISLAYTGASSIESIGYKENGGIILADVSQVLYGPLGNIILGTAIMLACLSTSVGLVSACSNFFSKLFNLSYSKLVITLSLFSLIVSNFGLTQLIAFSVPVLLMIYPPAIVLIVLSFLHSHFKGTRFIYKATILLTSVFSILDGLAQSVLPFAAQLENGLAFFPLYDIGIGWIIPAMLGGLIGALQQRNNSIKTNI
jgi:LIVCS family branched-chain amino acid:cation transporter